MGENFPNAMHYVVEKLGTAIGALSTDFGPNEIRVLYLAFIPRPVGRDMAERCCKGAESRATDPMPGGDRGLGQQPHARRHYLALGFEVQERNPAAERLVWYPKGD